MNSLSHSHPSEKRYFKLTVSLQKGNKNYLKLFDALERQNIYDEKEIKLRYKNESFVKNITFTKNYLYKLIFKSLISYHNEKSLDSRLNNILNRCRFMFDKALFPQYFKTVQLGKKLALKHERFSILLEFLELERQLTKKEEFSKRKLRNLYDEELGILEKIRNINYYKRAISALFSIKRDEGKIRNRQAEKRIISIISSPLFENEKEALSVIAKESYNFALVLANEIRGNNSEAYRLGKKRFKIIKENKEVFENSLFDNYKDSLISLISLTAADGKYAEAEKLFDGLKKELSRTEANDINISIEHFSLMLDQAVLNEDMAAQNSFIPVLEKILLNGKSRITIDTLNYFYFRLSEYFFTIGNPDDALRIINILFDSRFLKHTPSLEPYARLLKILIHYERRDVRLVEYLVSSAKKYLKNNKKLYRVESDFLNLIKTTNKPGGKGNVPELFKLFKKKMLIYKKDRFERNAFEYLDLIKWSDKKINQTNHKEHDSKPLDIKK